MTAKGRRSRYGPWALVTGASSGIGEAFARRLALEGFHLLLVARREHRLAALQAELAARHGIEAHPVVADLARAEGVERVLEEASQRDVGLVVSNAGRGLKGGFCEHSRSDIESMFDLNARAPLLLLHGLLPALARRQTAGIILTGSQEGEVPFPWSAAYAATKAFVHSLGQSLHGELRGSGVQVMVLAPGATDTEALPLQGFDPQRLPGLMDPDDVAAQALSRLGTTPLFIPGTVNRLWVRLLRILPRSTLIALSGKSMAAALEGRARGLE